MQATNRPTNRSSSQRPSFIHSLSCTHSLQLLPSILPFSKSAHFVKEPTDELANPSRLKLAGCLEDARSTAHQLPPNRPPHSKISAELATFADAIARAPQLNRTQNVARPGCSLAGANCAEVDDMRSPHYSWGDRTLHRKQQLGCEGLGARVSSRLSPSAPTYFSISY